MAQKGGVIAAMEPKVSICLPNLNRRAFLPQRLDSIFKQSFSDWELVVVDGYSDDGAWEYLREHASKEKRMRIVQAPRAGVYAGINDCIRLARGQFVYIATSDDTMPEDCLEKLVGALEAHATCGLAHCVLRVEGIGADEVNSWWRNSSPFAQSSAELLNFNHIRRAPLDGLLHLNGESVYISLTQLLVRRSLFDRIGFFSGRWGSAGDFHWNMRAALVTDTVHVPDTWAGWHLHAEQATHGVVFGSPEHRNLIEQIIDDALSQAWPNIAAPVREGLSDGWRTVFRSEWELQEALKKQPSRLARMAYLLSNVAGSPAARSHMLRRLSPALFQCPVPAERVRCWLRSLDAQPHLIRI